jgi:multiple sugar transport system ATP-binding protein
MGDRIVVMSAAEIQQVGTPAEVYYDPANLFVAQFIGSPGMNLVKGPYADGKVLLPGENSCAIPQGAYAPIAEAVNGSSDVIVGFRPEAVHLSSEAMLSGEVYATDMHGAYTMLHVDLGEENIIHIRGDRAEAYPIGTRVQFDIDPQMIRFFHPQIQKAIRWEPVHE